MRPLVSLLLSGVLVPAVASAGDAPAERRFTFTYEATVEAIPQGEGPLDIFLPVAQSDDHQEIVSYEISAPVPGVEKRETRYGNRFWHARVKKSEGKPLTVTATYTVRRKVYTNTQFDRVTRHVYTPAEKKRWAVFLGPNKRVPISGKVIDPIAREIAPGETSLPRIARAIYDYVVDNMEYKKIGTGWGNGDTYWACSAKYGNCTDFHALFNSLARNRGIPARFSIGFPVPADRPDGQIAGYHCWVDFYMPDIGWVPIDASEAQKEPARRDLYFGTHPADRIQFTTGRDLVLGAGHRAGPLNYFVYPHVELRGKPLGKDLVSTAFRYRDVPVQASVRETAPAAAQ